MEMYSTLIKVISPFVRLYHRLEVHGLENIPPPEQRLIFTPNHPHWFGWDAVNISCVLENRSIRWLSWSYDEHPSWDKMVKAFNGILHNNSRPFPYQQIIDDDLSAGSDIGIFPEGTNNPISKWGRVQPFFPGAVRLAVMAGVPVIPVSINGLEQASPIIYIKEEEKAPPEFLIAPPVIFPAKVTIRFGEPYIPQLGIEDIGNREKLTGEAAALQLMVLRLLRNDKPGSYAVTPHGEVIK